MSWGRGRLQLDGQGSHGTFRMWWNVFCHRPKLHVGKEVLYFCCQNSFQLGPIKENSLAQLLFADLNGAGEQELVLLAFGVDPQWNHRALQNMRWWSWTI